MIIFDKKKVYLINMSIKWSDDIEKILEDIRINSVIMSNEHKKRYLYLKSILRYFRLPVIIISGFTSVMAVGLQSYLPQNIISGTTCLLSLSCGIIGSIELYLGIQTQMENELNMSKDYYLLGIDIHKTKNLDRENRNIDGRIYLNETYGKYVKLIEDSNIIIKKIKDQLTPLNFESIKASRDEVDV